MFTNSSRITAHELDRFSGKDTRYPPFQYFIEEGARLHSNGAEVEIYFRLYGNDPVRANLNGQLVNLPAYEYYLRRHRGIDRLISI